MRPRSSAVVLMVALVCSACGSASTISAKQASRIYASIRRTGRAKCWFGKSHARYFCQSVVQPDRLVRFEATGTKCVLKMTLMEYAQTPPFLRSRGTRKIRQC